jgi:hypothetical protein
MRKKLYLFVEGEWDKVFFEIFLHKHLNEMYGFEEIRYFMFAEDKDVREQLRVMIEQKNINFLLCPDLDFQFDELMRLKKIKKLAEDVFKVETERLEHKTFVIVQMIESWYLAGFNEDFCKKHGIDFFKNTEDTTKGTFIQMAKKLKKAPIRFRDDLTKVYCNHFSIEEAKERNESFRKFLEKISLQVKRLS